MTKSLSSFLSFFSLQFSFLAFLASGYILLSIYSIIILVFAWVWLCFFGWFHVFRRPLGNPKLETPTLENSEVFQAAFCLHIRPGFLFFSKKVLFFFFLIRWFFFILQFTPPCALLVILVLPYTPFSFSAFFLSWTRTSFLKNVSKCQIWKGIKVQISI